MENYHMSFFLPLLSDASFQKFLPLLPFHSTHTTYMYTGIIPSIETTFLSLCDSNNMSASATERASSSAVFRLLISLTQAN